jgi:hypothetical protein
MRAALGVQLPPPIRFLLDNNLNLRFLVEGNLDCNTRRGAAVDGPHLIVERDLGRSRDSV